MAVRENDIFRVPRRGEARRGKGSAAARVPSAVTTNVAARHHPFCPLTRPTLRAPLGVAAPTPLLLQCQQCVRGRAMWRPPARQGGGERKGSIDDYGKGNNDRDELERGGGNTAGGKEGTLLKRKG